MRRPLRLAAILVLVAASCFAQDVARMDQVVESYVQNKAFMGSVLVARGATVIFSKSYGSANLEWDVPNTPSTKFRLGSITKQFTAASILLLEERGRLTLDDPIKKHLPDAPAAWDRITIFHLLTHSSGIPNLTPPEFDALRRTDTPPARTMAMIRDKPLDFAPGEKASYSNTGYIVLGALIEKVSGSPYARFVQDNIFTPLGMNDSGHDSNTAIIRHRAAGYTPSPEGPVNADYIHMRVAYAAGGLYSTTEDLLRWQLALFGGKILSAASVRKMTSPFKDDHALGVEVRSTEGRTVVEQAGTINGFDAMLSYSPSDQLIVAVLANINGPAAKDIAAKLATIALGGAVLTTAERKEIAVPKAALEKYVGSYDVRGKPLSVRLQDDRLTVQMDNSPPLPMFAESDTKFFLRAIDAQFDFLTDASGAVTSLIVHQNGFHVTAPRTNGPK